MSARSLRNAVTAVVLTAVTAAAGTACGSGEEPRADRERTPAAQSAPRSSPSPEAEQPRRSEAPDGKKRRDEGKGGEGGKPPKVPKAELTPATGSFTEKQKEYLVDRVPEGMDPAAVLEAGQAACDRIARTAEVDRKAVVSALRSGEIAGAEDAVRQLCPKYKPLLEAAGLTG